MHGRTVSVMLAMALGALARPAPAQTCIWSDVLAPDQANGAVYALLVFDDGSGPALYVGGSFTHIGGAAVNRIARWNGTTWTDLAGGMSSTVFALAVYKNALYAAGNFTVAGGVGCNYIARWTGTAWAPLGAPVNGTNNVIYTMLVFDRDGSGGAYQSELFVGGLFDTAGGTASQRIAAWNGTAWSPLLTDMNSYVRALAAFDEDGAGGNPARLYAGGGFTTAGGGAANYVARWDLTTWLPLAPAPLENGTDGVVDDLMVFDPDGAGPVAPALYVGGNFNKAGGVSNVGRIARWTGSTWAAVSSPALNDRAQVLRVLDVDGAAGPLAPTLHVGGIFTTAGGLSAKRIAQWDGSAWSALGSGLEDNVRAMLAVDSTPPNLGGPGIYVGGSRTPSGLPTYGRLARWSCGFAPVPGDLDDDLDVDYNDFLLFYPCLAGPDIFTPPGGCTGDRFSKADLQPDGDVDLRDFRLFMTLITGK